MSTKFRPQVQHVTHLHSKICLQFKLVDLANIPNLKLFTNLELRREFSSKIFLTKNNKCA